MCIDWLHMADIIIMLQRRSLRNIVAWELMQISDYDVKENEKKKMMNLCELNETMSVNRLIKISH